MALLISSIVRRYLKDTSAFRDVREHISPWQLPVNDEDLIGWYDSPSDGPHKHVVFTSKAIYIDNDDAWIRVAYDRIQSYEIVGGKHMSSGVAVRTSEGVQLLPFESRSGEQGQFSDAFALAALLRVVVLANHRRGVA